MLNGKVMIRSFNSWIDKKRLSIILLTVRIKNESIFSKPYEPIGRDINVKVDLSNYATKTDIKNISHVDTSRFELKSNLASLKPGVDKLDIDKLKSLPNKLSNLKNKVDK